MKAYDFLKQLINENQHLGDYKLGYYDISQSKLVYVSLNEISFDPDDDYAITVIKEGGSFMSVPISRIYRILKEKELVWHKEKSS